jgi:hypothetical protein
MLSGFAFATIIFRLRNPENFIISPKGTIYSYSCTYQSENYISFNIRFYTHGIL